MCEGKLSRTVWRGTGAIPSGYSVTRLGIGHLLRAFAERTALSTGVFAAKAIRHTIALIRTLLIESVAADVLLPQAPAVAEDESDCRKDDRYPIGLSDR
jgi:hypothetical protein